MKHLLISILILSCLNGFTQVVQLKGDTIKMFKTGGHAELVLQNATKNINGFLHNDGNGKTSFQAISTTNSWGLGGNAGLTSANFLGTIDNVPLEFRVNSVRSGKIGHDSTLTLFGYGAGLNNVGNGLVAIGDGTATSNSGGNATFIGAGAGASNSGSLVIGIGYNAALNNTHSNVIALGTNSKVLRDSAASYGDTTAIIYHGFRTAKPLATVDIQGNLRVNDGTQSNGDVLTTDANGFASWGGVNNGLSSSGTNLQLGGNLTQLTNITANGNQLYFNSTIPANYYFNRIVAATSGSYNAMTILANSSTGSTYSDGFGAGLQMGSKGLNGTIRTFGVIDMVRDVNDSSGRVRIQNFKNSSSSPSISLELSRDGQLKLDNYGAGTFTGTPTKSLQVDVSGNVIEGVINSGVVTSVTGTAPVLSSGGATPAISADTSKSIGRLATFSDNALKLNKANFVDSLNNYQFTFRPSKSVGDSGILFPNSSTAIAKKFVKQYPLFSTHNSGDSLQTDKISIAGLGSGSPSSTTFLRGDSTWATPDNAAKVDTAKFFQPADYVISKISSTYYAVPRVASGLPFIFNTDYYTVAQGAINALCPIGTAGSGGGKIHNAKFVASLSDELTFNGWEQIGYSSGGPLSQLIFEGEGWATQINQNTSGKNAIVIKNAANVYLRDLNINNSSSAKSCILGDSTGTDNEASLWTGGISNVFCTNNSGTYPTIYLRDFILCSFDHIVASNFSTSVPGKSIVLENASATHGQSYGNSNFSFIKTYSSTNKSPGSASLQIQSTSSVAMNLNTFDNFEGGHAYYGIHIINGGLNTFSLVDLESLITPVYFDDQANYNSILSGYLTSGTSDTAIKTSPNSAGNVVTAIIENSGNASVPLSDSSNFATGNVWDLVVRNSTAAANVYVANAFTTLRIKTGSGTTTKLPIGTIVRITRRTIADVAATIATSDILVSYTSLTATRAVTLPAASTVANQHFEIKDEAGTAGSNNITIVGTVDGASNPTAISTNYGSYKFYSTGSNYFKE